MDWQRDAACADTDDPDLFFPISLNGPGARQVERARAVCRRCPVAVRCAEWARETHQRSGVWGGVSVEPENYGR
ncbi:WhiB family transcriptional regulator [Streptomyces roseirectus]|uniref:Transcriptional regulator WhiB n=2 Tax=Streptomyces roseirectus TaxID=2768066 RepID=A0A7H0ITG6_9ACTN|nr:WhiB family transcriptional regulator [Streptomyces roseirectus]